MFHKSVVTSFFVFGFTTLAVMAQSAPQSPPNTRPPTAAPTAAPAQPPAAPAVANQNPTAPVRSAPAPEPANGQVGNNPLNTNQSIPTSQFMKNQNAVATSKTGTPAGVGYNNSGGMVNSDAMQSDAANQVHYHYHYDSAGQPIGNAPAGYAQATYVNPDTVHQSAQAMQSSSGGENSEYNYALNNDEGGMYQYQTNNWNPNSRVGPGGNGGGAGVNTTWNPYLNNGAGMLTYGGAGGVEGFND